MFYLSHSHSLLFLFDARGWYRMPLSIAWACLVLSSRSTHGSPRLSTARIVRMTRRGWGSNVDLKSRSLDRLCGRKRSRVGASFPAEDKGNSARLLCAHVCLFELEGGGGLSGRVRYPDDEIRLSRARWEGQMDGVRLLLHHAHSIHPSPSSGMVGVVIWTSQGRESIHFLLHHRSLPLLRIVLSFPLHMASCLGTSASAPPPGRTPAFLVAFLSLLLLPVGEDTSSDTSAPPCFVEWWSERRRWVHRGGFTDPCLHRCWTSWVIAPPGATNERDRRSERNEASVETQGVRAQTRTGGNDRPRGTWGTVPRRVHRPCT